MALSDDTFILKLKRLKWSDERIAQRMCIPVEEVQRRWANLLKSTEEQLANGIGALRQVGMVMVNQYSLMGQTLGVFTGALNNTYSADELQAILDRRPESENLVSWLLQNAIILKPFILPSPEKLIEEMEKDAKAPQN